VVLTPIRRLFSTSDPFSTAAASADSSPAGNSVNFNTPLHQLKSKNAPFNPFANKIQTTKQPRKFNPDGPSSDEKLGPEEEAELAAGDGEDGSMEATSLPDESESSEIQSCSSVDSSEAGELTEDVRRYGVPVYNPVQVSDTDGTTEDENILLALNEGLEPPPRPEPTHVKRRDNGIYDYTDTDSEINSENAPDYPQRIRPRSADTVTKVDEDGFPHDSEIDGHPLYSDGAIFQSDASLSEIENALYSESDIDWSAFESLGTAGLLHDERNAEKLLGMSYTDSNYKLRPGPLKIELPRLKPGAKIPKGWMVLEDGHCVPTTKEFVHHKYADPDLYQTPLHDRLANLVQEKLPKPLKFTDQDRESFMEVTQSGVHAAYARHPERVLKSAVIDDVIAKINQRKGPAKVMDFEENISLDFKTQDLSPFRRPYEYRMTAQGHALLDIPPKMLLEIKSRKTRSLHRLPGPAMDYSFMSTGYHKGMH